MQLAGNTGDMVRRIILGKIRNSLTLGRYALDRVLSCLKKESCCNVSVTRSPNSVSNQINVYYGVAAKMTI